MLTVSCCGWCRSMRIRLAHLFDPMLANHTSIIEPLPHQITAVCEMLTRHRYAICLRMTPGRKDDYGQPANQGTSFGEMLSVVLSYARKSAAQWQKGLYQRFQVPFEDAYERVLQSAASGSFLTKRHLSSQGWLLARNGDLQARLGIPTGIRHMRPSPQDVVSFFGGEVKETKRYIGTVVIDHNQALLLMTATPITERKRIWPSWLCWTDPI